MCQRPLYPVLVNKPTDFPCPLRTTRVNAKLAVIVKVPCWRNVEQAHDVFLVGLGFLIVAIGQCWTTLVALLRESVSALPRVIVAVAHHVLQRCIRCRSNTS